jgi:hypothetical protein
MNKLLSLCAAAFSIAAIASAQETPHYEFFAGGSFLFVHSAGSELTQLLDMSSDKYQPHNMNFQLYGWEGTVVENVNSWLGGEIDVGGFYNSPDASFLFPASELASPSPNFSKTVPVILRNQSLLFGPRFTWRQRGPVVLFVHLPFGVAFTNESLSEAAVVASNFEVLPIGTIKSSRGLAFAPGVGIDVRLNRKLMFRPIQVDYMITHLYGERQDNVRVSAGINLTFGEK